MIHDDTSHLGENPHEVIVVSQGLPAGHVFWSPFFATEHPPTENGFLEDLKPRSPGEVNVLTNSPPHVLQFAYIHIPVVSYIPIIFPTYSLSLSLSI